MTFPRVFFMRENVECLISVTSSYAGQSGSISYSLWREVRVCLFSAAVYNTRRFHQGQQNEFSETYLLFEYLRVEIVHAAEADHSSSRRGRAESLARLT